MPSPSGILVIVIIVALILLILGTVGYHYVTEQDWIHSFYASALTMAGLSLEVKPQTTAEKIFIAIFTLMAVGCYLVLIAASMTSLLEPVIAKTTRKECALYLNSR